MTMLRRFRVTGAGLMAVVVLAGATPVAVGASQPVVLRGTVTKVVDGDTELLPAIGPDIIYGVLCPYVGQDEALERAERYARTIS
jgi:hypothetical protein